MMLQNGVEKTYWFYSNGFVEEVNVTKMNKIYQSIGNFRSSQFAKESQLKTQVSLAETLQELDSVKWNWLVKLKIYGIPHMSTLVLETDTCSCYNSCEFVLSSLVNKF